MGSSSVSLSQPGPSLQDSGFRSRSGCFVHHTTQSVMSAIMVRARMLSRLQPFVIRHQRTMSSGHSPDGWKTWKKIFYFCAVPVIILGNVNAFYLADPAEHERPPFVPYEHLRIRTKGFPWGDGNHSLFHNSHANALPDGYEHGEEEE